MANANYPPGTRVRFMADSLGTVKADGTTGGTGFEPEVVNKGDEGVIVETVAYIEGWFYVKPDLYPELIVPVADGFVEKIAEGS